VKTVECANVAPEIHLVASSGLATLHELGTVYGVKDLYDLVEMVRVNRHNEALMMARD
jgi:hypothetical protein